MREKIRFTISLIIFLGYSSFSNAFADAPELAIEITGVEVAFSWTSVAGVSGYSFYYAPSPYLGPETVELLDVGQLTALTVNLFEGAAFLVAVSARDSEDGSGLSNVVEFSITAEHVLQDYMSLPIHDASTWTEYAQKLDQIKKFYVDLPTELNISPVWFNSIQPLPELFSSNSKKYDIGDAVQHGVGYGSYTTLPNGNLTNAKRSLTRV